MSTFFFFNDTATTEIYTLSLHDALPIWFQPQSTVSCIAVMRISNVSPGSAPRTAIGPVRMCGPGDGLSASQMRSEEHTSELQSRHISYAVFCLKKKKKS